jgi:hypothetical protein
MSRRPGSIPTVVELDEDSLKELERKGLVMKGVDVSQRFIDHHPHGKQAADSIINTLVSSASVPEYAPLSGGKRCSLSRFKETMLARSATAALVVGDFKLHASVIMRIFFSKIFDRDEDLYKRLESRRLKFEGEEEEEEEEEEDEDEDGEKRKRQTEFRLVVGVPDSTNIEDAKEAYTWCAKGLVFGRVETIQEGRASMAELPNNSEIKGVIEKYLANSREKKVRMINLSSGSFSTQVQYLHVTKEARTPPVEAMGIGGSGEGGSGGGVEGGGGGGGVTTKRRKMKEQYVITVYESTGEHGACGSSNLTRSIMDAAEKYAVQEGHQVEWNQLSDEEKWKSAEELKVSTLCLPPNVFFYCVLEEHYTSLSALFL